MREFEYFLFENFDADVEAGHENNPRNFLGKKTDAVLSEIAQQPENTCSYDECCHRYGVQLVGQLIDGGVLRRTGMAVVFDCPVFLRKDAAALHAGIAAKAPALANLLERGMPAIRSACAQIDNGFSVEQNLYHILCGMVFDGHFFDYLGDKGALAVSRQHPSGLDYLTVIYEQCNELRKLSDGLLCSYNRLINGKGALQSFGDADGDRFDFYRFFRLLERGNVSGKFRDVEALLDDFGGANKDVLLDEVVSLVQNGQCAPAAAALLERFGYVREGAVCVPVFTTKHQKYIMKIENIVENCLGSAMADTLGSLAESAEITAVRHGVDRLEIANELYHIVFGFLNEELVSRNIVAAPRHIPGEGRYFRCIEVY